MTIETNGKKTTNQRIFICNPYGAAPEIILQGVERRPVTANTKTASDTAEARWKFPRLFTSLSFFITNFCKFLRIYVFQQVALGYPWLGLVL